MKPFLFKKSSFPWPLLLGALAVLPTNLHAAGVVTSPTEANLRAALAGGGTVTFATGGTITLSAVLEITNDTLIDATGYTVTFSGNKVTGVLLVDTNVNFTLNNLTVANGQTNQGAGLYNAGGSVTLSNVTFALNQAFGTNASNQVLATIPVTSGQSAYGGAIYNAGALFAQNCGFLTNSVMGGNGGNAFNGPGGNGGDGQGAAIFSTGPLGLTNCVLLGNSSLAGAGGSSGYALSAGTGGNALGGAVFAAASLGMTNCTSAGNRAAGGLGGPSNGGGSYPQGPPGNAKGGAVFSPSGPLVMLNCTVTGNTASGGFVGGQGVYNVPFRGRGEGGGICNATGLVTIVSTLISSNRVFGNTAGAGLYDGGGTLLLSLDTLAGNSAAADIGSEIVETPANGFPSLGGGLYNAAAASITQCTFASNNVTGGFGSTNGGWVGYGGPAQGAGIFNAGSAVLAACTLAGNMAVGGSGTSLSYAGGSAFGSGIFNEGNQLAMINCTVANNVSAGGPGYGGANGYGGGLYANTNGPTALTNCTFSGNLAQGGVGTGSGATNGAGYGGDLAQAGTVQIIETIVNAGAPNNSYGVLTDLGYNISSDSSCAFTSPGSLNNTNPELQPLANNGGPTLTMALYLGSPAIDAGITLPGITTDQRGVARPYGPAPDIGAYEWSAPVILVPFSLSSVTRSNGVWWIYGVGPTNQTFRLQVSSNLVAWTSIATNNSGPSGAYSVQDNTAPAAPVRFYRIVSP